MHVYIFFQPKDDYTEGSASNSYSYPSKHKENGHPAGSTSRFDYYRKKYKRLISVSKFLACNVILVVYFAFATKYFLDKGNGMLLEQQFTLNRNVIFSRHVHRILRRLWNVNVIIYFLVFVNVLLFNIFTSPLPPLHGGVEPYGEVPGEFIRKQVRTTCS